MNDVSAALPAVRQVADGGGGNNFLLPNGTFFVVLVIFLIVLGVIGTFVVPPVMKVLRERENMVTKTIADNKKSDEQFAAAEADYEKQMSEARNAASAARDDARTQGRQAIEEKRSQAEAEAASALQSADQRLKQEGETVSGDLRGRVETLSTSLASRLLGVEVNTSAAINTGTTGR